MLWQVDAKLEGSTVFSITPVLCATNPPLGLGLVYSPLQGYICEGNEPWLRKFILHRQRKAMSADYHYSVAFTPAQASSFTQQSIRLEEKIKLPLRADALSPCCSRPVWQN